MSDKPPTYITDRRFGQAVAAEIAYAGLTQATVAEAISLDKGSFSRSIAGNRQWKATEIKHIAEFLKIPVSYLLEPQRPDGPADLGITGSGCYADNVIPFPLRQTA